MRPLAPGHRLLGAQSSPPCLAHAGRAIEWLTQTGAGRAFAAELFALGALAMALVTMRHDVKRKLFFRASPKLRAEHTGAVIWLHGLGDSGYGFRFLRDEMALASRAPHTRWILPEAPQLPITAAGGQRLRAWFDVSSMPVKPTEPDDRPSFSASIASVHALIDAEVAKGTASEDIVLGGFSQGGAMALLAGYSYAKRLAGVACLSGWPSPSRSPPSGRSTRTESTEKD